MSTAILSTLHEPVIKRLPTIEPAIFCMGLLIFIGFSLVGCASQPLETRGFDTDIKTVSARSPGGLSLICQTSNGTCFNQYPMLNKSECQCAGAGGMVGGKAIINPVPGTLADLSSVATVFFATDRNRTSEAGPESMFSASRSDTISYGLARVSIPATHQTGYLEAPSAFIRLRFLENAQKHVLLMQTKIMDKDAYFRAVQDRVASSPKEDAFIFIHGFNVSFENAARRTAQIAYDLGFRGAPVFYSWPSRGSPTPLGYSADSQTIEWSKENLKRFLDDFLSKTKAKNVYLVAHSMGNRALTAAFVALLNEKPTLRSRVKEMILAAPDIDAGIFKRDIAPAMVKLGEPITLYASSTDRALQLAHIANGFPRAGDAGPGMVVVNGVETIDATAINTSFLGHSSFAETREILNDWQYIIEQGLRASQRAGLMQPSSTRPYWTFKK
ncbi:alpha/beta hydrolase [Candidatus Nitrotoga arctica]|uniref:Esterase/lipase superfamily enzyme n=1 Tax=Candidatus Nitrotoga arctica TaxID=453162 RepID=A0ABM8YX17_9PROT|nr:alpha/beta fold hydrolase [Candidatus Nitrotoga arctica]CAG9932039.1 protein of unknown function [Candidatus Nitrotoga arctica]